MRPPCSLAVPPDQARDQAHRAAGRHRTAPLRPSAQTRGPRPAEAHRAHPSKTGARSGRSPARHPGGRSRRFRRACRLFVSVPRSGRRPRFHPFSDHFSPDRAKDGGLWPDPPRPRAPDDEERRRTHVAEGPSMHRGLRETRPTHRAGGDSQSPTTRRCRAGGRWRAGASSVTARPSSFAGTEARQQRPPYAANTVSNQPRCAGDHAKVRIVDQAANARTGTPRVFVWSAKTDPACGWLARSSGDRPFRAVVM
jgi:hypothetical protein